MVLTTCPACFAFECRVFASQTSGTHAGCDKLWAHDKGWNPSSWESPSSRAGRDPTEEAPQTLCSRLTRCGRQAAIAALQAPLYPFDKSEKLPRSHARKICDFSELCKLTLMSGDRLPPPNRRKAQDPMTRAIASGIFPVLPLREGGRAQQATSARRRNGE